MSTVHIDICMCTFRRPHIAETLRSLSTLELKPEWELRVIVADNDETPTWILSVSPIREFNIGRRQQPSQVLELKNPLDNRP